jgi:hypothetical protein
MSSKRAIRLASLFLLFLFCGSVVNLHAIPQNEQTSTTNRKHSKNKKSQEASAEQAAGSKLDINTALKQELSSLPGIGEAFAQKIVDGRPYNSKSDLVKRGVLPASTYDKIKSDVTAHRATAKESREPSRTTTEPEHESGASDTSTSANPGTSRSSRTETAQNAPADTQQAPPAKGMVWVNLDSGVYHREGDRWYGKTKHGKYISEADALKAGYRASKTGPKQ